MLKNLCRFTTILPILGVLLCSQSTHAQHGEKPHEKHAEKHAEGKHGPVKYVYKDHHGNVVNVDASDPKQFADMEHALKEGHVHELEEVKDFNILELLRFDLGLWSVVVFLLLFFILSKVAWKPMLEGLQKREQTIRAAVDEAKEARKETERVRAEFKAEMDKAYAEIPKMMEAARRDAQALSEEMRSKTMADIQTERQRLRREIETAKDQALQELWSKSAELATIISAKAIRRSLSEDDHRRLLDEALTELKQRERRSA